MDYEDIIIIEEDDSQTDHRNARRRKYGSGAGNGRMRIMRVPARHQPNSWTPRPYPAMGPQPMPIGYPPPMPAPMPRPMPPFMGPGPMGHPLMTPLAPPTPPTAGSSPQFRPTIPMDKLADGVTLAADAVAAIMPLPEPPPEPIDSRADIANQNEHRHAIASHDKLTQRLRTGGRVLGGLLKLVFGDARIA